MQKGEATMENSLVFSQKFKIGLPHNMALLLLCIYPRELETCSHKNLHIYVSSNITCSNAEWPKCPETDERKNEYGISIQLNVIQSQKGIKYLKKELNTEAF